MDTSVFYKVSFSHLKNLFLPNLGILGFQNPMVFFGKIPTFIRSCAAKLLDLGLLVLKIFPLG
jgi:hypothetical protein